jgi:hypothetical protein
MNEGTRNGAIPRHLTDEQLLEWLDGGASPEAQGHLKSCEPCRSEAEALQDGISRYAIAMRRQAQESRSAGVAKGLAPARRAEHLAQTRLRWVGAGVLAVLLAAQTAWMMRQRPAQDTARPIAVVAPVPQPNAAMSDEELLQAVNNDLSDEVPQALAPVGAITVARNQMAVSASERSEAQEMKRNEKQGENK